MYSFVLLIYSLKIGSTMRYSNLLFILSFQLLSFTSLQAGGMHPQINFNPSDYPSDLKANAKVQFLDKGFIDVTQAPYSAKGDGVTDDTEAMQRAVDDAFKCNLVVSLPSDRIFLLSKQLKCIHTTQGSRKFAYQIIGSTQGKTPILRLKDGSTVDNNIFVMYQLTGPNGKSNAPSLYGSVLRNVNIDMGNNPTVNALSMSGAQHCVIEDVKIFGISFNAGIYNLPGSGGGVVNLNINGGKIGILQVDYRPNPTIEALVLENQSEVGIKVTESRGPVIVTGFKITSPSNASPEYRAIIVNNKKFTQSNGRTDHSHANLCLTDGIIEVKGSGKGIYNFAQDVTMTNVYVKAAEIIESGAVNPPSKIVVGNQNQWLRIDNYAFSSFLDKSSASVNAKELNDRSSNFELIEKTAVQQVDTNLIKKHAWGKLPAWNDVNVLDIMSLGATPENINASDDDGKAIQKAIDAVTDPKNPNFGKTVFIPRGHFQITKTLKLKSGLKMIGAGKFISVIQAANDWVNSEGAIVASEDVDNGNLFLSDFCVLGYGRTCFLQIKTANSLVRDVVTESVETDYTPKGIPVNLPTVPYIEFSGNASGKVYHLSTDHIHSWWDKKLKTDKVYENYNLVAVKNTKQPLTFYQLSIEHLPNSPQLFFVNSQHISVFGLKIEFTRELLNIIQCNDIKIIGGSGNYQLDNELDRAIIIIEDSKNILIQNMNRKSCEEGFGEPMTDICKYWILDDKVSVTGDYSVLLYKK